MNSRDKINQKTINCPCVLKMISAFHTYELLGLLPVGLQTHLMLTASRPVNDLVFAISGLHTSLKLTAFRPVSYLVCCL